MNPRGAKGVSIGSLAFENSVAIDRLQIADRGCESFTKTLIQ